VQENKLDNKKDWIADQVGNDKDEEMVMSPPLSFRASEARLEPAPCLTRGNRGNKRKRRLGKQIKLLMK
jgi:hypothetical protein